MPIFPFTFSVENTFCISLDSRPDRWERMQKRFDFFDMEVQRWSASTGQNTTDVFAEYLNGGQRGCSQSHINIYRHILEKNIKYALILEDDACFDIQWRTRLNEFSNMLTEEQMEDLNMVVLNASEPMDNLFQWELQREQYLTGGYIITQKGAKWMLDYFRNCFFSADWMTTRMQLYSGNSYSYFPWLIIQEGNDSTIGDKWEADHNKVVTCLENIHYSIENNYI
jgi:glycosyl transferase family 25